MDLIKAKQVKKMCWDKLLAIHNNKEVKSCPNCKSSNIKKMIEDYNYGNYIGAIVLNENKWHLTTNPEVKQVDLLGLDPEGNDVAVEIKCDFYPSDNWFVEFWDSGKHKDYWEKAKTQQVYFGGICNKSKKLHLYDLTKFRKEEVNKFSPVDSKYGTTGFLWNRTYNYNFKIGSFDLGI